MDKIELVRQAFDISNREAQYDLLADDFQWSDAIGSPPVDKATWIGMGEMLQASFPDLELVIEDIREEGDEVRVAYYTTGTFTNDFDLSAMGMDVIPASGKKIKWPTITDMVTVKEGQITRLHNTTTGPDAGIAGLLKLLGAG